MIYQDEDGRIVIFEQDEPAVLEWMLKRHGIDGQLAKELRSADPYDAIANLLNEGYSLPGGVKQADEDEVCHELNEELAEDVLKEMELTAEAIDGYPFEVTQDDVDAHMEDNLGLVWDGDVGGWVVPEPPEEEQIPWNNPEALAEYEESVRNEETLKRFEQAKSDRIERENNEMQEMLDEHFTDDDDDDEDDEDYYE